MVLMMEIPTDAYTSGKTLFHIETQKWEEVRKIEKYEKARMEVIEFEAEDVITTSNDNQVEMD